MRPTRNYLKNGGLTGLEPATSGLTVRLASQNSNEFLMLSHIYERAYRYVRMTVSGRFCVLVTKFWPSGFVASWWPRGLSGRRQGYDVPASQSYPLDSSAKVFGWSHCGRGFLVTRTSKDDVKKHFREEQSKNLQQTVTEYKELSKRLKAEIKANPMLPIQEQITNSGKILVEVLLLTETWKEVMPYIRKIKSLIDDVLGQNRAVACYWGKVPSRNFQNLPIPMALCQVIFSS